MLIERKELRSELEELKELMKSMLGRHCHIWIQEDAIHAIEYEKIYKNHTVEFY